jgi:hypothetical protein
MSVRSLCRKSLSTLISHINSNMTEWMGNARVFTVSRNDLIRIPD